MANSLRDVLRRFRPAVAPGPAGPAGVPADHLAEMEVELAPVFAALEPTLDEVGALVARAGADAERIRREGAEESDAIIADARAHLDEIRASEAAAGFSRLDAERARLEADTAGEVARVRAAAAARIPALVDRTVAAVWATAGVDPAPPERAVMERAG